LTPVSRESPLRRYRLSTNVPPHQLRRFTTSRASKERIIEALRRLQLQIIQFSSTLTRLAAELRDYQLPDTNCVQDSVIALAIALEHAHEAQAFKSSTGGFPPDRDIARPHQQAASASQAAVDLEAVAAGIAEVHSVVVQPVGHSLRAAHLAPSGGLNNCPRGTARPYSEPHAGGSALEASQSADRTGAAEPATTLKRRFPPPDGEVPGILGPVALDAFEGVAPLLSDDRVIYAVGQGFGSRTRIRVR
jgi:hypothetical protein